VGGEIATQAAVVPTADSCAEPQLSPTCETAMKDNKAVRCPEDEHDWCEVPLHEESRICALCGEIRQDLLWFTSVEPTLNEIPIFAQAYPPQWCDQAASTAPFTWEQT
jgi:hypothetical protein